MKKYVMALDQGTTSSRCILFDKEGNIMSVAQKEFTQYYPKAGWVEQDPKEIWSTQMGVIGEALAKVNAKANDIETIGITNQRETTIVWNKHTGEPVYPAIVWQCRRTAPIVDELKKLGFDKTINEKTGLVADAYFSASKIQWILENVKGAMKLANNGDLLFGTVDTWLIWNMTQGESFVTDYTNASRTMLFDIHNLCWDDTLIEQFKVPHSMLPKVLPSSGLFGYVNEEFFGCKIPITGVAGDQQAALFGQCCFNEGEAKNTYGTGCFLLMNTGEKAVKSNNGLLTTIAASTNGKIEYALEGSVFVAGAAVQWLRDELQIIRTAQETESLALSVEDSNGVCVVPAFTGLGAPHWNQYARGAILGLTRGAKKEHIIRATLESLGFQTAEVIRAMEKDSGILLTTLKVDGGASANAFIMQFQADILGAKVVRPTIIETTALGAAYLAGLYTGYWKDEEDIKNNCLISKEFSPSFSEAKREELLKRWEKAIQCTIGFIS